MFQHPVRYFYAVPRAKRMDYYTYGRQNQIIWACIYGLVFYEKHRVFRMVPIHDELC